jgi:hypothetical protein
MEVNPVVALQALLAIEAACTEAMNQVKQLKARCSIKTELPTGTIKVACDSPFMEALEISASEVDVAARFEAQGDNGPYFTKWYGAEELKQMLHQASPVL